MKYKKGDKVRIKSLDWYNNNKNNKGAIVCGSESFTHLMSYFCNKVVNIITIQDDCYRILEDDGDWYWTDEMIEGLVEEVNTLKIQSNDMETETHKGYCTTDVEITNESKKVAWFSFYDNDFADKVELDLSNRELIQEDGKWFVVKKKKSYPNTYEECYHITGLSKTSDIYSYKNGLLFNFQKLLIARDAYWKVAGEEMGLDKPWEPDFTNDSKIKYCIGVSEGKIQKTYSSYTQCFFAFPTAEMRDAFKEYFYSDLEICKKFL